MDKKYKNHVIISMEAKKKEKEKVFDKIQHVFLIKALEKVGL